MELQSRTTVTTGTVSVVGAAPSLITGTGTYDGIALAPTTYFNVTGAGGLTINVPVMNVGGGGTAALVKTGSGTLTLTASNNYSGGTTITGGVVALGTYDGGNENAASLGSGSVSISNNAQITFGGTGGGTVVTTTITNNFSVNGGVFFGEDGYQNLTGTVTIGPGGLTAYTQWNNKDVALGQLAGSGPLVVDTPWSALPAREASYTSAAMPATRERSRSISPASSAPITRAWAASWR